MPIELASCKAACAEPQIEYLTSFTTQEYSRIFKTLAASRMWPPSCELPSLRPRQRHDYKTFGACVHSDSASLSSCLDHRCQSLSAPVLPPLEVKQNGLRCSSWRGTRIWRILYDAYAISLHLDLPIPARLSPSLHHVESRMPQQPNRPIPVVSHGMSAMFLLVAWPISVLK